MRRNSHRITRGAKVAIFCSDLSAPGGAERLVFEEAEALRRLGREVAVLTFSYTASATFSGRYQSKIVQIPTPSGNVVRRFLAAVSGLTRFLRNWRPDIVVAMSSGDCARLLVPAFLTRTKYITHINGTQFWFPPEEDLTKYSWRYRNTLRRILEVSPQHAEFVPTSVANIGPVQRIRLELTAILHRIAVRRSRRRIAFSRRMAWEIELVYGRPAQSLKGAFPESLLDYVPKHDPVARYRIRGGPVVLNINRLEPRKRVALAIEAFALFLQQAPDAVFLIGGVGPSDEKLRFLVEDLGLEDRVHFLGFVKEDELWDWLASCDVFVHPNWAEFAIAPYEALAVGANVVWSTEMETEPVLETYEHLFPAAPEVEAMAEQIMRAARTGRATLSERATLRVFSWEHYFSNLNSILDIELKVTR